MSNIDLAKVILSAMFTLAHMVCFYQRRHDKLAKECEEKFLELFDAICKEDE